MVCVPAVRLLVLKEAVATPALPATLTALPALLPSIWNCTVPVGVPLAGFWSLTVAVKVKLWPATGVLSDELTVLAVPGLPLITSPPETVLLLPAKLLSPL